MFVLLYEFLHKIFIFESRERFRFVLFVNSDLNRARRGCCETVPVLILVLLVSQSSYST